MDRKKVKNLILESADNILDEATVEKLVLLNEEFIEQRVDEKTQEYKETIDLLESTIEENQEKYEAELQEAVNTLIEKELEQEDSEDEEEDDEDEDSEAEEELKEAVNRIIELEILLIEKEEQEDDEDDDEDEDDESDDEDDDEEQEDDDEDDEDEEKEELKEQVQILTAELEYVKKMGILVEMLNNDNTLSDNQKDLVISNATKLEMETLTQFEDEVREIMKQIKTKGKLYESKQNKYSDDDEEVLITESTKKVVKVAPLMKESKASIEPTFIDYSGLL